MPSSVPTGRKTVPSPLARHRPACDTDSSVGVPVAVFWPIVKEWADRYQYSHLPLHEEAGMANSWYRVTSYGGGYGPWEALSASTDIPADSLRGLKDRRMPVPFAAADLILAGMGRTEEWFGRLADWYLVA